MQPWLAKEKAKLDIIGLLIYRACEKTAKDMLQKEERRGNVTLKGSKDDLDRSILVMTIIETVAKDSDTEKINREAKMLGKIKQCVRNKSETTEAFANRFDGGVARYITHTVNTDDRNGKQWAVLLIQNANLTPDTGNEGTFQLTTRAVVRSI